MKEECQLTRGDLIRVTLTYGDRYPRTFVFNAILSDKTKTHLHFDGAGPPADLKNVNTIEYLGSGIKRGDLVSYPSPYDDCFEVGVGILQDDLRIKTIRDDILLEIGVDIPAHSIFKIEPPAAAPAAAVEIPTLVEISRNIQLLMCRVNMIYRMINVAPDKPLMVKLWQRLKQLLSR